MTLKFYCHNAATANTGIMPPLTSTRTGDIPASGTATSLVNKSMDGTIGAAQASLAKTTLAVTTAQQVPIGRWISSPIAAQSIAVQTIDIHMAGNDSSTVSVFGCQWYVDLWRPSTGVAIAHLVFASNLGASVSAFSSTTETAASSTQSSVAGTAQDGDVLYLEVWRNTKLQTMATAYTNTLFFDGTTEDSATTNAAYLLFANDVAMLAVAATLPEIVLAPRR